LVRVRFMGRSAYSRRAGDVKGACVEAAILIFDFLVLGL
jgi:hypothetical protein